MRKLFYASAIMTLVVGAAAAHAPKSLGKLGQTISKTTIFRKPSRKSPAMAEVNSYRYLVINPTDNNSWLAVTMSDGSIGFVDSDTVAKLPYEVTMDDKKHGAHGVPTATIPAPNSAKQEAIQESFKYIGTPYKWGGENLNSGIDCSSFVQKLYSRAGISLPRTAKEQAIIGQKVARLEDLQPGDRLYFWSSKRGSIGHTGIFLGYFQDGGAYFIHSSSSNHGVATDDLRNPKWRRILVDARRD